MKPVDTSGCERVPLTQGEGPWAERFRGEPMMPLNHFQVVKLNRLMPQFTEGKLEALGALLRAEWEPGMAAAAGESEKTIQEWEDSDEDFHDLADILRTWVNAHFDRLAIRLTEQENTRGRTRLIRDRQVDMDPRRRAAFVRDTLRKQSQDDAGKLSRLVANSER